MREIFQKLNLRELHMVLLGLGAAVTAAIIVAILLPNAKQLRSANQDVRILVQASQDGVDLDHRLQEQHARIEDLKFSLYGDMANLPVKQMESYIIGRLQRVSWENNIELVSVEPATGERIQIFQEILFNVRLIGQYADLYHWLLDTRNELGYVVVKEYGLTRHNDNDSHPLLQADLSLASYRAVR